MERKLLGQFLKTLVIILTALIAVLDRTNGAPEDAAKIKSMIEKIKTEASPTKRQDGARHMTEKQYAAMKLKQFIRDLSPLDRGALDTNIVDDIASLLSDQDHVVRYEAAAALGFIGAPAKRVVPALLQALKDEQRRQLSDPGLAFHGGAIRIGPAVSIEDVIVGTLEKLKVCNPSPDSSPRQACDYLLH